ncbi:tripartite tricarboxylate transporter substrate binding protein [Virgibacillus ihumii]|uniref:tripartite tricarboxylate transporter substrate binding protein n=1 Tax=Virgibacillus ihumii TaxID=2686091 RepID=UPI00157CD8A5|nr:tripartite tricarboxylate transporter substrate binding protein [Virgibacillus ihumii]
MKKFVFILTVLMLMFVTACSSGSGAEGGKEFPTKNMEMVAPATPGGGWDTTARSMKKVLSEKELIKKPISVVNKPGGNGEVGWKYLKTKDGHTTSINSSLVITNNLLGHSELTYKEFTPLAILTTEWIALAVPADSKFDSAKELFNQLKKKPKSAKVAVAPGLGNDAHLSFVQASLESGVDVSKIEFMIYGSGGDQISALVGGHVDAAVMSVSEVAQQHKAGKAKILAVTSEKRLDSLKDVPTYKEQGIDMVFPHWRGIMGPPDMSEEAIAYWDKKLSKMVKTDEWKKVLENNQWESFYKNSEETKKYLKEEVKKYSELLKSAGLTE